MRKTILLFTLLSLGVFATRVLPHAANFSPISALLLILPLYFPKQRFLSLAVFAGLFFSDLLLGFHGTMWFVYGSFLAIALIGILIKDRNLRMERLLLPFVSAFLFFVITNFGVWATTQMYTKDMAGLLQSYWMGIPFLKMTLFGDIFFFTVFYGIWKVLYFRRASSIAQTDTPARDAALMRITASSD